MKEPEADSPFASQHSTGSDISIDNVNDRRDCFQVSKNEYGEHSTYSRFSYSKDELIYTVRGEPSTTRSRESIEIGLGQHVEDPYAMYLNHSFQPNLYLKGRHIFAIRNILVGEELTFNYLNTETEIASPFTCHATGRRVSSDDGRIRQDRSGTP